MSRVVILCTGLLVAASLTAAPPLPLDLVPADCCIGLSIRDLADLKAKSEKVFKENRNVPRLSQLFDIAYGQLGLGWKVDEKKSAAIICATGPLGGFAADSKPEEAWQIATALPYSDLAALAKAWKVSGDDFAKGTPTKVPGRDFDRHFNMSWAGGRDGVAYISGNAKSVTNWMNAVPLRQRLPAERVKWLDTTDGLVYFGPPLLKVARQNANLDWVPDGLNEREAAAFRRVNRAFLDLRYGMLAFRLDDGIAVDVNAGFDPKGKDALPLLEAFNKTKRSSSLAGLPDGPPVIGALSLIGVDELNLEVARVLASQFWLGLRQGPFLLTSDTVHLRRIFTDLYAKLNAGRGALYQSGAKQLALVAVLEPKKAETFLKDLGAMARVADDREFDPKAGAGKAEIEKLVADLASDDYDTREAASTRLALIGAPILPYLEKAEKSTDAEARRRATELRTQIEQVAALRKKEATQGLLKTAFHPIFGWKANAEERAGVKVHHLTMRFERDDAPYIGWLKEVFGDDWSRIRLADVGGKVVVMIGSDTKLYEEALTNVRAGKPGLEASPLLANFRKQASPSRRAELHVALGLVQALTTPADMLPKDFKPTPTLSSGSLRTGPADVGVDFYVPQPGIEGLLWLWL